MAAGGGEAADGGVEDAVAAAEAVGVGGELEGGDEAVEVALVEEVVDACA